MTRRRIPVATAGVLGILAGLAIAPIPVVAEERAVAEHQACKAHRVLEHAGDSASVQAESMQREIEN